MRSIRFEMIKTGAISIVLLGSCALALSAEVTFAGKPSVKKEKGNVRISFAVSAATDVEVGILNSKGEVVRHLAAGMLGGKKAAPAPFSKGLSQSLVWDGKADDGKKAEGGPFKVRVGLGMKGRFGRIIGGDPYAISDVTGIATDKDGNVYVMHNAYDKGSDGPLYIQKFDSGGKYINTILPAPANMPFEKIAAFGAMKHGDTWLPFNYWARFPHFQVFDSASKGGFTIALTDRVTDDGKLVLFSPKNIYSIGSDGSAIDGHKKVGIWPRKKPNPKYQAGTMFIAASPDGKYIYVSGVLSGKLSGCVGSGPMPEWPDGRVYRMEAGKSGSAAPFADVIRAGGKKPTGLRVSRGWSSAHGVAVDSKGNVLVCDRANNRIAVFSSDGKFAGELPVANPNRVFVNSRNGEVYVITKSIPRNTGTGLIRGGESVLIKFSGWAKGNREMARLQLGKASLKPALAVSDKETVIWLGGSGKLLRILDKGKALEMTENICDRGKGAMPGADRMGIDKKRNEIYVNNAWADLYRYDGETGKGGKAPFAGADIDVGPDGNMYVLAGLGNVTGSMDRRSYCGFKRVNRDGKPVPFAAWGGKHEKTEAHYGRYGAGYSTKGICVAPDGKTYILDMYAWNQYWVTVWDKNGKYLGGPRRKGITDPVFKVRDKGALIDNIPNASGGVKVDRAGNIYIGVIGVPKAFAYPEGMDGKSRIHRSLGGSVVKFSPAGGTFYGWGKIKIPADTKGIELIYGHIRKRKLFAQGATMVFPGTSPCSVFGDCACRSPRFELDEYGRLYLADVLTCRILVYDAAGNLLRTFGQYGNMDSAGPKSLLPKPELAFAWPISVCVSKRNMYVADVYNRRVTRVDLGFAAEETVRVP
jgi:DNA-binding beta-propeller fold protein YncE